ncbi:MAG TPA: CHAD domain-containing protein [Candidatus Binatia bacterium]|nr:CHAD domain-containing protein [Candidatus Binatia bacterium]
MPVLSDHAKQRREGLRYWMRRVLQQVRLASRELSPEAVHDLRVALRRCRSLAAGLSEVDGDPGWDELRRTCRKLFRRLGELRDLQVLNEWVMRLAHEGDPVRQALLEVLAAREPELKQEAAHALSSFDRRKWLAWSSALDQRTRRLTPDGLVAQHLALERWEEARALHRRALRSRTAPAWHALRIGLKRFRYTVENFLPQRHAEWGADLKRVQDQLGEVHDLDVLRETLPEAGPSLDDAAAARWGQAIERERTERLDGYRAAMGGRNSLWYTWRGALPSGERLEAAALAKLTVWASGLDPDTAHSRQVARLAVEILDGLVAAGFNGALNHPRSRTLLHAAGLLHNVGRSETAKGHHKASYRLISALAPPLGWTQEEIERVAILARYHCGSEPREKHRAYHALPDDGRGMVRALAGVLRVADALDDAHDGAVRRIEVRNGGDYLMIRAAGWEETEEHAAILGGRKHLLESAIGKPIIVRAAPVREAAILTRPVPRGVAVVAD